MHREDACPIPQRLLSGPLADEPAVTVGIAERDLAHPVRLLGRALELDARLLQARDLLVEVVDREVEVDGGAELAAVPREELLRVGVLGAGGRLDHHALVVAGEHRPDRAARRAHPVELLEREGRLQEPRGAVNVGNHEIGAEAGGHVVLLAPDMVGAADSPMSGGELAGGGL
jgi:hypothetical protein